MALKPFKPPSIKQQSPLYAEALHAHDTEPPLKRRKFNEAERTQLPLGSNTVTTARHNIPSRQPLQALTNSSSPEDTSKQSPSNEGVKYFSVLWRKVTQRKNKTWDDDGYVSVRSGIVSLYDGRGKQLSQGPFTKDAEEGVLFSLGGRDIEISDVLSSDEFKRALGLSLSKNDLEHEKTSNGTRNMEAKSEAATQKPRSLKEQMQFQIKQEKAKNIAAAAKMPLQASKRLPFKQPLRENTVLLQIPSEKPIPRHDPEAEGALLFTRPKQMPASQQLVDVVLDPLIGKRLRSHQKDGIIFLYECVMNLRAFGGQGCILADDMGLGKTLQTIALIWTLTKQNPIYKAEPVVKKALIVCPVSLIQNWKKEFRKWLGRDRLGVLTLEDKGSRLSMFDGKNFKVLIVGYERLRNIAEDLTRGAAIDLVICDEGHRLKTLKNKSAKAIETLNTPRRIILSGTPIQNDLSEFFAMANFVNDGCLGSYKSFVRDFENPIMKSRQPNATAEDIEKGQHASTELAQTTSAFILRRTADILAKYLPPKTEYVLFCKPTPEQARIYLEVVKSPMFQSALGSYESALQLITILKKLCNSPALMRPDRGDDEATPSSSLTTLNEMLPVGISRLYHNSYSSKIRLLDELLQQIRTTTNDKIILVSNYTSTLNLMANLLDSSGGRYLRLDGTVPQNKRQSLVDEFNQSPASAYFAFLLSAKAGGMGLNLIGANRLVLFDVDWNPATDDQAMARIHREGQKKPCKIYRFVIKGGLEERIWQRQVVKRGLADSIMEGSTGRMAESELGSKTKKGKAAFSREELRDLFRLDESDGLRTHDLISCDCAGQGVTPLPNSNTPDVADQTETSSVGRATREQSLELPNTRDIIKASYLTHDMLEEQERAIASGRHHGQDSSNRELEKHELMMYSHLDTAGLADLNEIHDYDKLANFETILDDQCLMQVLRQDRNTITGRVAYVFKKTTAPDVGVEDVIEVEE